MKPDHTDRNKLCRGRLTHREFLVARRVHTLVGPLPHGEIRGTAKTAAGARRVMIRHGVQPDGFDPHEQLGPFVCWRKVDDRWVEIADPFPGQDWGWAKLGELADILNRRQRRDHAS